jgi:hypothetical protein
MKVNFLVVLAVLGPIVLLLAACGGNAGPPGTPTNAESVTRVKAVSRLWEKQVARISYDVANKRDIPRAIGAIPFDSSVVLYWRPPDWRLDVFAAPGGQGLQASLLEVRGTTYVCTPSESGGRCITVSTLAETSAEVGVPPFAVLFAEPRALRVAVEKVFARETSYERVYFGRPTLAGLGATCFQHGSNLYDPAFRLAIWCFTDDGLFLYLQSVLREIISWDGFLHATEVSRQVTDADFQLPYPLESR